MEKLLAFLYDLYHSTNENSTKLSLTALAKKHELTNLPTVSIALQRLGIVEVTRCSNGLRSYFWVVNYPDIELAQSLSNSMKEISSEYSKKHADKVRNRPLKKKKAKITPTHIAPINKYLIPFSANDLRYVNTIEEGIELISSAVVAAGDYNIYQLVSKVQKVSKIKITNIKKND